MKLTPAIELSVCGATHMHEKSAPVNLRPRRDLNLSSIVHEKLSDVDKLCAKLGEKHKGEYSKDQLRAWAHMINMGNMSPTMKLQTSHFGRVESDSVAIIRFLRILAANGLHHLWLLHLRRSGSDLS